MRELSKEERGVEVVWRAFELRPDPVPTLDPAGDYLQNAWRNSVYPLARQLGVRVRLPPVQPRTRLAHEAAHWARAAGRFEEMNEAIFRAFFERGEDVGRAEVLASLAAGLGLDAGALGRALDAGEFRQGVLEDEREAEELGVGGVPAFVADRRAALSGVQPVESLRRLVAHTRSPGGEG